MNPWNMSHFGLLNLLTLVTSWGDCCFCWMVWGPLPLYIYIFKKRQETIYATLMSKAFLWCHFVVFAALPDIIKWIDISNICSAQRALIQPRWTLDSSRCGTASGVCLFNHSCGNKIKRQCVAKPSLWRERLKEWKGITAGGRMMESRLESGG